MAAGVASSPAAFLGLVLLTLLAFGFFVFLFTAVFRGAGGFLFSLKEPAAPVPLVWTSDLLATRRLMAVRTLALFVTTSYPPAFKAFFRAARDTPPRSEDADAAFRIRSDSVGPVFLF